LARKNQGYVAKLNNFNEWPIFKQRTLEIYRYIECARLDYHVHMYMKSILAKCFFSADT